jgi:hypothetical protein
MSMEEIVHLLHTAYEGQEWWKGPHPYLGWTARSLLGQQAYERLPERFRGDDMLARLIEQSRVARAGRAGEFSPRLFAFVPTGWTFNSAVALSRFDRAATILALSEPAAGEEDAASVAERVHARWMQEDRVSDSPPPLSNQPVLGHLGVARRFVSGDRDGMQYLHVEQFCVAHDRAFAVSALLPANSPPQVQVEVDHVLSRLDIELRRQPELKRFGSDFRAQLPEGWYGCEALEVGPPGMDVSAIARSEPTVPGADVAVHADLVGSNLRQALPGYREWTFRQGRVFGGRDGLLRGFAWSADGKEIRRIEVYYVELDRLFTATGTIPKELWTAKSDQITTIMDRFLIV